MTEITVAALQLAFTSDLDANIAHVSELVREAAGKGAQVILPPELFEGEYFCRVEDEGLFATAKPVGEHKAVLAMQNLARELGVTIPTSFFEADGPHHYNSLGDEWNGRFTAAERGCPPPICGPAPTSPAPKSYRTPSRRRRRSANAHADRDG